MRWAPILLLLAVADFAAPAHAAPMAWAGVLSIRVASLPVVAFSGAGTLQVNGAGGPGALSSVTLPAGTFTGSVSVPVTDPAQFPIAGLAANVSAGAGVLAPGGVLPIGGHLKLCLQLACATPYVAIDIPLTGSGTRGVGIGGPPLAQPGLVNLTLQGAPWATGMVSAGSLAATGFVHGPASGGVSSAAAAGGAMQLVTPIVVSTSIGAFSTVPMLGVLEIRFVPEPGTLLLVATGVGGLALAARRRVRRLR